MPRDGSGIYHTPTADAVPDTTIESSKYNVNVHDVETDLNTPRPITAGGTGATSATDALLALSGEIAKQVVTNFDAQVWQSGSFYAETSSTGSPVSGHAFVGIAYYANASDFALEARDLTDTAHPTYYRIMSAGVWGAWKLASYDAVAADARFVNVVGDTMTGQLIISTAGTPGNSIQFKDTVSGLMQTMRFSSVAGLEWINSAYTVVNAGLTDAGNFSVRGNITAGGNISGAAIAATGGITAAGNIQGSRITATGDLWSNNGVIRFRGDPTGTYIYNDGTQFLMTQSLNVGGTVLATNLCRLNSTNLAISDGTSYLLRSNSGIYFQDASGGMWGYINGSTFYSYNAIQAAGTVTGATINSTGNIIAGGNCYSNYLGHQTNSFYDAGGYYRAVLGAFNPNYAGMSVAGVHYPGNYAGIRLDSGGGGYAEFRGDGTAWKNGGGSTWGVISDARIKNVVENYQSGLDAIAALNPVRFSYKDNASWVGPEHTPEPLNKREAKAETIFVGLLAQEAEIPMPEMFIQQPGYIDGIAASDIRSADYSPLMFALVNAIKELKARIELLEAA